MAKHKEALLIMHLSSLDNYYDICGPGDAFEFAELLIDAMLSHRGPVIVVDMLWEMDRVDSSPRSMVYERALYPMLDSGKAILVVHDESWESDFEFETGEPLSEGEIGYSGYWPEFFQELLPVLNELEVDRVRMAGFWYDPEEKSGCAWYTGQWLSRAFDVVYDEEILARYALLEDFGD